MINLQKAIAITEKLQERYAYGLFPRKVLKNHHEDALIDYRLVQYEGEEDAALTEIAIIILKEAYNDKPKSDDFHKMFYRAAISPPIFMRLLESFIKGKRLPNAGNMQHWLKRQRGIKDPRAQQIALIFFENLVLMQKLKVNYYPISITPTGPYKRRNY